MLLAYLRHFWRGQASIEVSVSSVPICAAQASTSTDRRAHPRRRLDQLAYIGFGPDSGGVLLDVSEGGLRCQIVGAVIEGDMCHLKFALPGRHSAIETEGQVVWSNRSKQGGGVRLLGLGADVRQQLQQWINGDNPPAGDSVPAPTPVRTGLVPAMHGPSTNTFGTVVAVSVGATPAAKQPLPPSVAPHPPAQLEPQKRMPLTLAHAEPQDWRATRVAVIAGCVVLGVAALAFSDFNLARVTGLVTGETRSDITAPASDMMADPLAGQTGAGPLAEVQQHENIEPASASDAGDRSSSVASQPARPELEISSAAPAPSSRPIQRPPAAATPNRQQLAMALPRPRMTSPAPPAVAAPEPVAAAIVPPPVVSMDLQPLDARPPEAPQPARPPAVSSYQQPQLLSRVEPVYSRYALLARLQGTVQISATIGADGVPRSLTRVSGQPVLADMAFEAVRQWRYQPASLNGQPVEAQTSFSFTFQLR